ncbi:helix-turn-helix domain-containing protein [Epilithonimonas sp. UC225_85]|uniref:helix-turn-helix domain-containing protein n=1 Tax=Epilithonimonas sp. UC225_85 TaxID=3350167 RepID=UPI0036D2AE27
MNIVYSFICFLLVFFAKAQKKDTLAKYTDAQLTKKASTLPNNVYAETLLQRNISDSINAEALYILAGNSSTNLGDFCLAAKYHKKSLVLAKKTGYKRYVFLNMSDLCLSYIIMGKNSKALSTLTQLKKYKNDLEYEMNTDEAKIHYLIGDFEKANVMFKEKLVNVQKKLTKTDLKKEQKEWLTKRCFWLCQSLVSNYNYQKKPDSADFYMQQSKKYDINNFFKSGAVWANEVLININCGHPDEALAMMKKYQERIIKSKPYIYQCFYYKALCYQMQGDNKMALAFAEEAIKNKMPSISYYQNYELECYMIASQAAKKIGDLNKMFLYSNKYLEYANRIDNNSKLAFISKLYSQDLQDISQENDIGNLSQFFLCTLSILLLSLLFLWELFRVRAEKINFQVIIESLNSKKPNCTKMLKDATRHLSTGLRDFPDPLLGLPATAEENNIEDSYENSKINISLETEKEIIKKMELFEKKNQFLSPDISLGKLALDFKTNNTYITYVIKKYRNDSFVNYINKLRINYIIHKMTHHKEYSNYKIEYLARESGFSSYSTFKRIFTKQTGMDPSIFIEYVRNSDINL